MAPRHAAAALAIACACKTAGMQDATQDRGAGGASASGQASIIDENARRMLAQGREIFRDDTFGSEDFFGGALQLHRAIAGQKNGGLGDGVSPKTALSVGLKVDAERVPAPVAAGIKSGAVSLDDPANTLALLKASSVVGVRGIFQGDRLTSLGITCAFCHSSPAGTCTRERRSESTISSRDARPTAAIAPLRSKACSRGRRAASTTMAASQITPP